MAKIRSMTSRSSPDPAQYGQSIQSGRVEMWRSYLLFRILLSSTVYWLEPIRVFAEHSARSLLRYRLKSIRSACFGFDTN